MHLEHAVTHRRRRQAYGLAALSLTAAGVMLGQPADAPGTAKEPRPASHFRLVLQSTGETAKGRLFKDSITLREIAPKQVFTFKQGQRLKKQIPPLKRRLDNRYTKQETDQGFLSRADALAGFLTKAEAEGKFANVLTGVIARNDGEPLAPLLEIPGFGTLHARADSVRSMFRFDTTSTTPIHVTSSNGPGGTAVAGSPYDVEVPSGNAATVQLIKEGPVVASLNLSVSDASPRQLVAQVLIGSP